MNDNKDVETHEHNFIPRAFVGGPVQTLESDEEQELSFPIIILQCSDCDVFGYSFGDLLSEGV